MGCYIAPYDASTIEAIVLAISQRPRGADLLVESNLNPNLESPEGNMCDEYITVSLAAVVLEYMSAQFLPWHKPWLRGGQTWIMI